MKLARLKEIYLHGWLVILMCGLFAIVLMVFLIPFNLIELIEERMPRKTYDGIRIAMAILYGPLAFYWSYAAIRNFDQAFRKMFPSKPCEDQSQD